MYLRLKRSSDQSMYSRAMAMPLLQWSSQTVDQQSSIANW
jgi:hypothetical protein